MIRNPIALTRLRSRSSPPPTRQNHYRRFVSFAQLTGIRLLGDVQISHTSPPSMIGTPRKLRIGGWPAGKPAAIGMFRDVSRLRRRAVIGLAGVGTPHRNVREKYLMSSVAFAFRRR